jgi:hypothetical protein
LRGTFEEYGITPSQGQSLYLVWQYPNAIGVECGIHSCCNGVDVVSVPLSGAASLRLPLWFAQQNVFGCERPPDGVVLISSREYTALYIDEAGNRIQVRLILGTAECEDGSPPVGIYAVNFMFVAGGNGTQITPEGAQWILNNVIYAFGLTADPRVPLRRLSLLKIALRAIAEQSNSERYAMLDAEHLSELMDYILLRRALECQHHILQLDNATRLLMALETACTVLEAPGHLLLRLITPRQDPFTCATFMELAATSDFFQVLPLIKLCLGSSPLEVFAGLATAIQLRFPPSPLKSPRPDLPDEVLGSMLDSMGAPHRLAVTYDKV